MAVTTSRKVAVNVLAVAGSSYLSAAIRVVINLFFYNWLSKEFVDRYQGVQAFYFLFAVIIDMGFDYVLLREYTARPKERGKVLFNGMLVKLVLAFSAMALCWTVVSLVPMDPEVRRLTRLFSLIFPILVWPVFMMPFKAEVKNAIPTGMVSLISTAGHGIRLALAYWLADLEYFIIAAACVEAVKCFGMVVYYKRRSPVRMVADRDARLMRSLVRLAIPNMLLTASSVIYLYIDQAIIASFRHLPTGELANYAVAVMIVEVLMFVPGAMAAVIMPLQAVYVDNDMDKFSHVTKRIIRYAAALVIPGVLFLSLFAAGILHGLFGGKYDQSASVLPWLAIGLLCSSQMSLLFNALFALKDERRWIPLQVLAALMNVVLNLLWIPKYGMIGAANATMLSYAFGYVSMISLRGMRPYVVHSLRGLTLPIVVATVLMGPVAWLDLSPWLLLISAVFYLPVLVLTGYLDSEDWIIIRAAIKGR